MIWARRIGIVILQLVASQIDFEKLLGKSLTFIKIKFGSGYDISMELEKLKTACLAVVTDPELIAHDITGDDVPETFCNRGFFKVASAMGCTSFRVDQSANQMAKWIETHWQLVDGKEAQKCALAGKLVAAWAYGEKHGHIATVFPGPLTPSGKWKKEVPLIAQVGKSKEMGGIGNGIMGANYGFSTEPSYSVWENTNG